MARPPPAVPSGGWQPGTECVGKYNFPGSASHVRLNNVCVCVNCVQGYACIYNAVHLVEIQCCGCALFRMSLSSSSSVVILLQCAILPTMYIYIYT